MGIFSRNKKNNDKINSAISQYYENSDGTADSILVEQMHKSGLSKEQARQGLDYVHGNSHYNVNMSEDQMNALYRNLCQQTQKMYQLTFAQFEKADSIINGIAPLSRKFMTYTLNYSLFTAILNTQLTPDVLFALNTIFGTSWTFEDVQLMTARTFHPFKTAPGSDSYDIMIDSDWPFAKASALQNYIDGVVVRDNLLDLFGLIYSYKTDPDTSARATDGLCNTLVKLTLGLTVTLATTLKTQDAVSSVYYPCTCAAIESLCSYAELHFLGSVPDEVKMNLHVLRENEKKYSKQF